MQVMNSSKQGVVNRTSLFAVAVLFGFFGFILNDFMRGINYEKEIVNIISCNYPSDFLSTLGFSNREGCLNLNLAIHKKALDICEDKIGPINDLTENQYKYFEDRCVYYFLSFDIAIPISREWKEYQQSID